MVRKGLLDTAVPRLKQYMAEHGEPLTTGEVAEFLDVSSSAAYSVVIYMEAIGVIHHVKRGRKNLYFLKAAYDESHLAAMLSSVQATHRPKQSRRTAKVERIKNSI